MFTSHPQIGQCKQGGELRGILHQSAVTHISPKRVPGGDTKGYFDNISCDRLVRNVCAGSASFRNGGLLFVKGSEAIGLFACEIMNFYVFTTLCELLLLIMI